MHSFTRLGRMEGADVPDLEADLEAALEADFEADFDTETSSAGSVT